MTRALSLRFFLIGAALISGVVAALAPPVGYYYLKYSTEAAQIEIEVQAAARRVARFAYAQGQYWVFQQHRLEEALAGNRVRPADQWRRVIGPDGAEILALGAKPISPLFRQSPVIVNDAQVASVEIAEDMVGHERTTVWIAACSALFGLFVFAVVYVLPLRALDRAFAALNATNADLESKNVLLERSNAELDRSRIDAEAANRAKSQFLANMSHELRTPLNAVIGFTEMVRSQFAGPLLPKYAEYLADVHRSGTHLLKIINDVLTQTRIDEGAIRLKAESVKIGPLVQGCYEAAKEKAPPRLTLSIDCAEADAAVVVGDTGKLREIFSNLLDNAVKFTPAGGSILVRAGRANGLIEIGVKDTGIGMSGEEMLVAVRPFRQADESHTRKYGGIGLGPPIAKSLIELHKGTLRIESAPGKGTTVSVSLPEKVTSATAPPLSSAA